MNQSFSLRVARLFQMRDRFEAGDRCTVLQLADEFDVSRRTIFRDIELLKELGFSLVVDKATHAYFLPEQVPTKRIPLLDVEATMVLLLAARVSPLSQVPSSARLIHDASATLLGQLSTTDRAKVGETLSRCTQETDGPTPKHFGRDVLLNILAALQGRSAVKLVFRDAQGRRTTAKVFLRQLTLGREGWYVEGRHATRHESIRVCLDEIEEVDARTRFVDSQGDSTAFPDD